MRTGKFGAFNRWLAVMVLGAAMPCLAADPPGATVLPLSKLDLTLMTAGWEQPRANRSVESAPLRIGGREFASGVGTHAESEFTVEVRGAREFKAQVGVDDEVGGGRGSVEFVVEGDGRELWRSGVMKQGDPAHAVAVPLAGVTSLVLRVCAAGDGIQYDHADWADAVFLCDGPAPVARAPAAEEAVVLTPPPPPTPRINGPRVYGARPGHPVIFRIPATGDRPMTFSAEGLPAGLTLDPQTGILSGAVAEPGSYRILLRAANARGQAQRDFRLEIGDRIALTPPMGWNSWNCFAHAVTDRNIRDAARIFVEKGLVDHGWSYVNIDDFWETKPETDDPTLQGPARDGQGRILTNPRFPDMKGLTDYIHSLGLKTGLYSSPGPLTCGGCVGSYQFEEQDARRYAEWGFDYLKYDWCSYGRIAKGQSLYELMKPYFVMRDALRRQDRDIVFSLCQYGMGNVSAWGDKVGGQLWRTTGDITDTWDSLSGIGFSQNGLEHFAGPGNWNDPDMLIVGWVGWGPRLHPTRLTPNEQYTHISLWCLLAAPLLIGCDLTKLDDFTLGLLTNDEVLEVNQDPLGRQASRVAQAGGAEVWAKAMEDGSLAVGLFNRGGSAARVAAAWKDLGLAGPQRARDLWRQKDLGVVDEELVADVPRHGVVLIRLWPAP